MNIWDYTRNDTRINDGAVLTFGTAPNGNKVTARIARIHHSNKAFKQAAENIKKMRQSEIDAAEGDALQEIMSSITTEAAKIACITGWTEFTHKDGSPMDCTKDNIDFIEKALPELFDRMIQFGATDANYIGTFDEDESVKN